MMNIEETAKKIVWLGHDCFRIDGDKIVFFDPYQISPGTKADLILVTHEHFDHCSPGDIAKIQKPETVIVTEKDSAKKLEGNVKVVRPGQTIDVDEIKIEAVPAYNTDKTFHPKENGWLGFIVDMEGVRIYHAGDTDFIPEMNQFEVDIALLPVSGTYVMTAVDAIEAALAIRPKLAIPMHYGAIVGGDQDAKDFKIALEGKVEVLVL
ncbi:MAG: MBL fold metallo-hydrolase [Desulfobacterales bacterium]|jgi:L-ascorbate metabolism protein UlaG (beta-lactamase superfamily)|nr:MBL fold metallo-hydrolase [Desulfobacterales bacterium]MDP7417483.1 MBL fold metallo-hydrolase [Desulfobacterales bacterium]HJO61731.1 MBL fold metallo-hydrolase [Desulfobacterales bacterium]